LAEQATQQRHDEESSTLGPINSVERSPQQAKAQIGYVPDRPFLYEKLTGNELIRFTGQLYGADPDRLTRRADELLDRLGLRGWEDQLIESYSYGMRQKIVLTAVFAREPRVYVIDEPIVGLDPRAAKTLRDLLKEQTRAGCAILLSTHSVGFAEQMADRIGIIAKGRLLTEGTMAELRAGAGAATDLEEVFLTLTREERDEVLSNELGIGNDD